MTTAMITACFTGLVRAVGMLLTVIILAEYKYIFLSAGTSKEAPEKYPVNPSRLKQLFSGAFYNAKENSVCNPYHFKNALKLAAHAAGFIFFINPGNHQSSFLRRNVATRGLVFADSALQKITTCL